MAIRTDGDWEGWLKFFLKGIFEVSQSATITARSILDLREKNREKLLQLKLNSNNGPQLLNLLFEQPLVNIQFIKNNLGCAYVTANNLVDQFQELGLLKEITGWKRNRLYRYEPYLKIFDNY
ncbi:MAG: hypothetical protein RLZZ143_3786 [Cyanobacteriota bacterium]|jgi:Fic family protein